MARRMAWITPTCQSQSLAESPGEWACEALSSCCEAGEKTRPETWAETSLWQGGAASPFLSATCNWSLFCLVTCVSQMGTTGVCFWWHAFSLLVASSLLRLYLFLCFFLFSFCLCFIDALFKSGIDDGGQALEPMDTSQKDALAPCVFRWEGGGRQVYITGTFNRWSEKLPMHRSGNDFTLICDVPRTKHAYKFIVDGEWRFAPDQKTIADTQGNINNFVDMSDFVPILVSNERGSRRSRLGGTSTDWLYSSSTKQERQRGHELSETGDYDDEEYGQYLPSVHDYNKEPPLLPPQLKHIMLNSAGAASAAAPDEGGQQQLPMPQHVTLKHLYCTAIKVRNDGRRGDGPRHHQRRARGTGESCNGRRRGERRREGGAQKVASARPPGFRAASCCCKLLCHSSLTVPSVSLSASMPPPPIITHLSSSTGWPDGSVDDPAISAKVRDDDFLQSAG